MSRSRVGFSCMYKDSNYSRPIDTFGYLELVMNSLKIYAFNM
jgi:hypothetical protein